MGRGDHRVNGTTRLGSGAIVLGANEQAAAWSKLSREAGDSLYGAIPAGPSQSEQRPRLIRSMAGADRQLITPPIATQESWEGDLGDDNSRTEWHRVLPEHWSYYQYDQKSRSAKVP